VSSPRSNVDARGAGIMVVLCAVLGLHQVVIKLAAPDMAPILQIALRSGLSALLLILWMLWRRERFDLGGATLPAGLLVGTVFAVEFIFVAEGLRFTTASHMAVFLYTAPIFTALALHLLLPAERLRRHQWLGIALAFLGIVAAFAGGLLHTGIDRQLLWGDCLAVLAGVAWASTTVIIRCSKLADAPATRTLLYQLIAACVLLLGYAGLSGQAGRFSLTPRAWGSILFQGVVITFAVYLAWFSLLRRYHASQLSVFLFMTPLFGVSFGVLILHDPIDRSFALGSLLVLGGLALVGNPRLGRSKAEQPRPATGPATGAAAAPAAGSPRRPE
jgi:drug/metabolite transporter (DMT)-like permease